MKGYIIFIIALCGCGPSKEVIIELKNERIAFQDNWTYTQLRTSDILKVLYFEEKLDWGLSKFPNLVVGVSSITGDTIIVLDRYYEHGEELPTYILVAPATTEWTMRAIEFSGKPVLRVPEETIIDMLCNVDTVFYGKIVELPSNFQP